ncbi:hypothetical protein ACOMHN_060918 [Nucella lapillus]
MPVGQLVKQTIPPANTLRKWPGLHTADSHIAAPVHTRTSLLKGLGLKIRGMKVWLLFGLLLGGGVVGVCRGFEEWLFPLAMMKSRGRHRAPPVRRLPAGVYARPVDSHVGWNTRGGYRRGPVRDAQWYDNNT